MTLPELIIGVTWAGNLHYFIDVALIIFRNVNAIIL